MNNSQKIYSNSRLEMLLQNCHDIEAQKITERILSDVDLYVDGAEQSDDITLLVLHRKS
jgi:hypothetical protein